MNPMQALINGMSSGWQTERAATQMTLGCLIKRLEQLDPEMKMTGIDAPHSYRGYYIDLAFESAPERKVSEVLCLVKSSMGKSFTGYKGGEFDMGEQTPVWVAAYGCCGKRIMEVLDSGEIVTREED